MMAFWVLVKRERAIKTGGATRGQKARVSNRKAGFALRATTSQARLRPPRQRLHPRGQLARIFRPRFEAAGAGGGGEGGEFAGILQQPSDRRAQAGGIDRSQAHATATQDQLTEGTPAGAN